MSIEERAKRAAEKIMVREKEWDTNDNCPFWEARRMVLTQLILSEFSQPDVRDEQQKPRGLRLEWKGGRAEVCSNIYCTALEYNIGEFVGEIYFKGDTRDQLLYSNECCHSRPEAQVACGSALESIYLSLREKFGTTNDYKKRLNKFV
jgi:hypothetical protein